MRSRLGFAGFAVLAALAGSPIQADDDPVIFAPQERLLLLPIEFSYFQPDLDTSETITGKIDNARRNLDSSVHRALKRERTLQFAELPDLSTDEQAVLREHIDLMRFVAISAVTGLMNKAGPWRDMKTWRLDYGIGNGLAFLAERTGIDKAIFFSGARVHPSTDRVLAMGAALLYGSHPDAMSNMRYMSALLVDLRSGDVLAIYSPVRSLDGEAHDVGVANGWVHALFAEFPERVRSKPPFNQPSARKYERHVRGVIGFAIMPPKGWRPFHFGGSSHFRRHYPELERISIDAISLDRALRDRGVKSQPSALELGDVAMSVLKADPKFANMAVVALTQARVAGRDGFRAELTSRLNIPGLQLRERHVVYGVSSPRDSYMLRFDAPAIYYFDRRLAEFEAAVSTFELL
jgi:hypothetical protein